MVHVKLLLFNYKIEGKESDFVELLLQISQQLDNKETLMQKANELIELKPNFFGIGINFNKVISEVLKRLGKDKPSKIKNC